VNALARRASSNPNLKSAEAWLARTPSMRIRKAFDKLTEHAEHARQLNQLAGRLIQNKLQSISERLDVLRPTGWSEAVYYPEGFASTQLGPKGIIGSA
jgi:flagellar biosynthesis/type III secretory pathway chaperone